VEEIKVEDIDESELSIEDSEKELIHKALTKANGNRKEAAALLGISERTMYRKMKEYNL
jgi:transcriptional regulator of acetoin/glycerol metabolism